VVELITVYVSIGNSDDKLTQPEWALFWGETQAAICRSADRILGEWMSAPVSRWQNACTAFEVRRDRAADLRDHLARVAAKYRQDSIAWSEARTYFITPVPPSGLDRVRDAVPSARGGDAPVQVQGFA
jgi:hypothetical protein